MQGSSRRRIRGGVLVAATAAVLAGCGGSGDDAAPPAAERAATMPEEVRADLGVVTLDARIGRVGARSAGVVVDARRGLILTTAHSLWGAHSLKVETGLGVLHGRILARDPCDDLAVVETQPRIPGLVAVPATGATAIAGQPVQSAFRAGGAAASAPLSTQRVAVGSGPAGRLAPGLRPAGGLALDGPLPHAASGSPLLAADGGLAGLAVVVSQGATTRRAALPWALIDTRLRELRSGGRAVYVGWSRHYRCAGALHAYAAAAYPGFRPADATLNAAVPASRLPGTEDLD